MGVRDNTLEASSASTRGRTRCDATGSLAAERTSRRTRSTRANQRESEGQPVSDRRGVVKLLAASAVGAVAGAALNGQPAAATDATGDSSKGGVNEARNADWIYARRTTPRWLASRGGVRRSRRGAVPATPCSSRSTRPPLGQPDMGDAVGRRRRQLVGGDRRRDDGQVAQAGRSRHRGHAAPAARRRSGSTTAARASRLRSTRSRH